MGSAFIQTQTKSAGKKQFSPYVIKEMISSRDTTSDDFQIDEISGLYKLIGEMGVG
jgi:hypothetical protein